MQRDESSDALPGQDSFLDIVANIVGILILLVMVVGLRVAQQEPKPAEQQTKEIPSEATPPTPPDVVTDAQVKSAVRTAMATRRDLAQKLRKAAEARNEADFRDAERVQMSAMVASVEQEIEDYQNGLDEGQRRDFELLTKIGEAEHELDKLTLKRIGLASIEPAVEQIESLPTPLASTVSGDELQIRLSAGHAKIIPWDALNDAARTQAKANLWRLDNRDEITMNIGPIDGFRVEYQVVKKSFATRQGMVTQIGSGSQVLVPESEVLGEPVDQALQLGSQLMTKIAMLSRPRKPTITIWTYPDSFSEFRELKADLFAKGYSVAGRPMPADAPIGRSPNGTKSAAQ